MEYISPEENALFVKALRFLYEQRLEKYGFTADIYPVLREPQEPDSPSVPA